MAARLPTPAREPAVMTIAETAAALRIGRTTAYELVARGELPVVRVGRRLRVVRAALNAQLARQLEEAAQAR